MQTPNIKLAQVRESLELTIDRDSATHLPLMHERKKVLKLILAYLLLPYNIAEYGCGKKCNIILQRLVNFGIPAFALKRGMILERDMSDRALAEEDFNHRKHALVVENPLFHLGNFEDGSLKEMLHDQGIRVNDEMTEIEAGDFVLSHKKLLQFRQSRSHIFPIVTFWDPELETAVEYVTDPTVRSDALFRVMLMRRLLNSNEALIFTAPMLGHFRLDENYLTKNQKWELRKVLGGRGMHTITPPEMHDIVRELLNASPGSVGDPDQWSYANNFQSGERFVYRNQLEITGSGDELDPVFAELLEARAGHSKEVLNLRDSLVELEESLGLRSIMRTDARWSEESLKPLAEVDHTVSYHDALCKFKELMEESNVFEILTQERELEQLTGIASKLQERIERLALLSRNREGEIDARALSEPYNESAVEMIAQMNKSGLSVFIDQVGNIHGLLLGPEPNGRQDNLNIEEITRDAICFCSHIDTVKDAGKYDGRLGVLSGIQIADIIHSFSKYFNLPVLEKTENHLMVSAFVGEEMSFTGQDVSMPGSAAVCGQADPSKIYEMENADGEKFEVKLVDFLTHLQEKQIEGKVRLMNNFSDCEGRGSLLKACYPPTSFFSPNTYERHIEQGPVLDRWGVPVVLVSRIMGILQEDFLIEGARAEEAALELNLNCRKIALQDYQSRVRATMGIMEEVQNERKAFHHTFALHWTLHGEKNHAGATLMADRKDPGVAAARLARKFREHIGQLNQEKGLQLKPSVGGIIVIPGTDRNVIPDRLLFTMGIDGGKFEKDRQHSLMGILQNYLFGTLSKDVEDGGEGIAVWNMEAIDFSNLSDNMRVSLDARAEDWHTLEQYMGDVFKCLANIEDSFDVKISHTTEQIQEPFSLDESGQVLQIERSYGGSHNPNEAQLTLDLLRGTLLQYAVYLDVMGKPLINSFNLYRRLEHNFPLQWQTGDRFISGALHDTCNVAARVQGMRETVTS